jgi:general secretion pathway protein C
MAGAILENGARIEEIYRDHVVLAKGAQRTELYLEATGKAARVSSRGEAMLTVGGPPRKIEEAHLSIEVITDYLRPVPVYANGIITGFQVYPGAQSAPFNQWGLKAGDIVTDLDGQPLTESDQAMGLFRSIADGEAMTAKVHRSTGETVELTLDGRAIEQLKAARNALASIPAPGGPTP